jgi:toxin ParE1/3/4
MKTVRFAPLAELDLEAIWSYIAADDAERATDFINALVQKCGLLAQNSALGKTRSDLLINLRSFPHKNYIIFYFPTEYGADIYRVLHGARDIDEVFDDLIGGLPSTDDN